MIKLSSEAILSLADAAKELPRRRAGKRPHPATLHRWARRGLRGIKLEVIRIGGTTCTSREALQRFFDRLTESAIPAGQSAFKHHDESIDHELEAAGL